MSVAPQGYSRWRRKQILRLGSPGLACTPAPLGVGELCLVTRSSATTGLEMEVATDNAEDFNLGGRAATSHLSDRQMVGARSVRLKVGCAKPVLGLAGQLLYV